MDGRVFFARKEIGLSIWEAIRDIAPYFLLSMCIVVAVHWLTAGIGNLYISLVVKVLAVAVAYCAALWLLGSIIFREAILFITKRRIE